PNEKSVPQCPGLPDTPSRPSARFILWRRGWLGDHRLVALSGPTAPDQTAARFHETATCCEAGSQNHGTPRVSRVAEWSHDEWRSGTDPTGWTTARLER